MLQCEQGKDTSSIHLLLKWQEKHEDFALDISGFRDTAR
jgi:hypothetical protein